MANTLNKIECEEGQTCEFKLNEKTEGLYETISAFANTDGGIVYIGADDNGNVVGLNLSKGKAEQITNSIIDNLHIHPEIECLDYNGLRVLKVMISKSDNPPVKYKNAAYKRIDKVNRKMSTSEEENLLLDKKGWDKSSSTLTVGDVDDNTFKKFIERAVNNKRISEDFKQYSKADALKHLGLLVGENLTKAGALLFCDNHNFINASIRVVRFHGIDKVDIVNDKLIEGNLFRQVDEAETAMKLNIQIRLHISGKLEREDIWEYPLVALREALLNSVIHRAYYDTASKVQIEIFADRIWFYNPGGLFNNLTVAEIKQPKPSRARNAQIMDMFYRSGLVESVGTGIQRMMSACRKHGLPEPEFKEEFGGFTVTMYNEYKKLNERQRKAIEHLRNGNEFINNEIYRAINNLSDDEKTKKQSQRDLKELYDRKILDSEGSRKGTKYFLNVR
jgi:ATP-dependent DNA helicase RecG